MKSRLLPFLLIWSPFGWSNSLPAQGVVPVHSVLPVAGTLLDAESADEDGDGLDDLFLAVRRQDGGRELRIHRMRPSGSFPAQPDRVIPMKADVVAWGLGDFRPEAGVEILLTTRNAAFSLSPRKEGYRGNLKLIVRAPMLLDLPAADALPFWPAVGDLDGDGLDEIAFTTFDGFQIHSADGTLRGTIPRVPSVGRRPAVESGIKFLNPIHNQPLAELLVPDEDPGAIEAPPVLYSEVALPLPFLVDADGDGHADLLYAGDGPDKNVYVHFAHAPDEEGLELNPAPDRRLGYASDRDWDVQGLEPVAAGGGPAVDLMVTRKGSGKGLTVDWQVLLFLDPFLGEGGLSHPDSLASVSASYVRGILVPLGSGAGRPDLALTAWSLVLRGALGSGGVKIRHLVLGFPAEGERGHARQPFLRYQRDYDADDFTAFSLVPALDMDLNGDGLADLLESDSHGTLEERPLHRSGKRVQFAVRPERRMEVDALGSAVLAEDFDHDGLGDLLILREGAVECYVGRRRGAVR